MGLFDGLTGQLGGLLNQGGEAPSSDIVGALLGGGAAQGGIGGVLETMAANGLADHIAAICFIEILRPTFTWRRPLSRPA